MRINIGAGHVKLDGFASVDKYTDADYKADILSLPFPDNSISEIYTSHTLEILQNLIIKLGLHIENSGHIIDHAVQSIIIKGWKE